jgi:1,4-alpha-glucan branching enzyme
MFGQKFLREWSRTLHMICPTAILIAEDHTGWDAVTKPPAQGGLGFDGT